MKALVLSAGGVKGAYQAGALIRLASLGHKFDIICGSSIGAINASILAQYPKESFAFACKDLKEFWINIKQKDIYKRWFPFGQLHALWQQSFYNSKPLDCLIHNILDTEKLKTSRIELRVGTVSIKTGAYKVYTQNSPNIKDAVVASSSFPPYLTPKNMGDDYEYDAGLREYTPIRSAIKAGATELYIICTEASDLIVLEKPEDLKTLAVMKRFITTLAAEVIDNDLREVLEINEKVRSGLISGKKIIKCHLIKPSKELVENSLIVNKDVVANLIKIGYNDVKEQIG